MICTPGPGGEKLYPQGSLPERVRHIIPDALPFWMDKVNPFPTPAAHLSHRLLHQLDLEPVSGALGRLPHGSPESPEIELVGVVLSEEL